MSEFHGVGRSVYGKTVVDWKAFQLGRVEMVCGQLEELRAARVEAFRLARGEGATWGEIGLAAGVSGVAARRLVGRADRGGAEG